MTRRRIIRAFVAVAITASIAPAQAAAIVLSDGQVLSRGSVVQIDMGARNITIEQADQALLHESMIMTLRVSDPGSLRALTPGHKVRFEIGRDQDGFIMAKIENAN